MKENKAKPTFDDSPLIQIESKKLDLEIKKLEFWTTAFNQIVPSIATYVENRMLKHETPIMKTGIWLLASIVFVIVIGTGILVFFQKLDASNFTFVIGTVLGYLLSFSKIFVKKESE